MHDQIRIAPDRRGEMRVFLSRKAEVPDVLFGVTRLHEGTEHQVSEELPFRFPFKLPAEPLKVLRPVATASPFKPVS